MAYRFGGFSFDPERLVLEHRSVRVHLPERSLVVLRALLESRGETVTRDTLIETVWSDAFVEDANLTVAVSTLRKTLAVYEGNEYIRTVPRRGYVFQGEVTQGDVSVTGSVVMERSSLYELTIENVGPESSWTRYRTGLVVMTVLVAVAGVAGWQMNSGAMAGAGKRREAEAHFARGEELMRQRRACDSVPHYREAIAIDPEFALGYAGFASALSMCEPSDDADEAVNRAIELAPDLADVRATQIGRAHV